MEQVARDECLHNCNSKHFKDRKNKANRGKNWRESVVNSEGKF